MIFQNWKLFIALVYFLQNLAGRSSLSGQILTNHSMAIISKEHDRHF